MTQAQTKLLVRVLHREGAAFIKGAEVKVARSLESKELVTIEDNGEVITPAGRRVDGERWFVKLTPTGLAKAMELAR